MISVISNISFHVYIYVGSISLCRLRVDGPAAPLLFPALNSQYMPPPAFV